MTKENYATIIDNEIIKGLWPELMKLTNDDIWFVGQMHQYFPHDCKLSPESGCEAVEALTEAYSGAKNEQMKRKVAELRTKGD